MSTEFTFTVINPRELEKSIDSYTLQPLKYVKFPLDIYEPQNLIFNFL